MHFVSTPLFEDHCREAVLELSGALLDLYKEVGSDPTRPQDVARRFKLNKNLTWKIAKIVQAKTPFEAVPLIPGSGGMDILLNAMSNANASEQALKRVRNALHDYEDMIDIHVGDRASLELMLDGMGSDQCQLEKSRKLVYQGNTGLWGIQARTLITTQFFAPSAENPLLLDAISIAGLHQVRRLRSIPRWTAFRIGQLSNNTQIRHSPIDPDEHACPGLIRAFCQGHMPEIHIARHDDVNRYELGDGPIGRTGEFSCYIGHIDRSCLNRYATDDDKSASLFSSVNLPVRTLLFDVFVHRDLYSLEHAKVEVFGKPWDIKGGIDESARLPIHEPLSDLGRGANVATPLAEHYPEVINRAFERAQWNPNDFRCLRLIVEYPPMSSTICISFPLPNQTSS